MSDGSYWVYQYDALGQVTRGSRYWSDGSAVAGQSFTYGFDGIGNRTASGGRASALSTYQPANRWNQLTSRSVAPAVDVIGTANPQSTVTVNRDGGTPVVTSRHGEYFHTAIAVPNASAAYPKLGVTASGPGLPDTSGGKVYVPPSQESYTYDLDGNLTSDSRWKYRWDAENRLVEMTGNPGTAAAGNQRITFGYDAAGRRISKRYTPSGSTTTTVTLFVHDGWNLVAEFDGVTFAVQRTYAWGSDLSGSLTGAGGVGGLLWETVAGNGTHFVSYDGNGNVMGLNSATDGSNTARYEYGPFGEPIRASGPRAADGRIRFSSKYTDQESGLVYYGYRFYNAVTGRWINRDPIGETGGLNLAAFVNNGGVNTIDFLGCEPTMPTPQQGPCCPDPCAILKAAIEAVIKTMEDRYWKMLIDPKDLYHNALKGPTGPNTPYGTWEGHKEQYEGWRNRLNRLLQDFYAKNCKDRLPPGTGPWAMRPAPAKPWHVENPGAFGPPSLPIVVAPIPDPVRVPVYGPNPGGGISGETVAVGVGLGVGAGAAAYFSYRCLRMIPSLVPPMWPTIPANLALP